MTLHISITSASLTSCLGCRKGKRECTYPGDTEPAVTKSKSSRRKASSPTGSSPSGSDPDAEHHDDLPAIPDMAEDEFDDEDPVSAATDRKLSDSSSSKPHQSTSPSTESSISNTRLRPVRTTSRQSTPPVISRNPRWSALPKDVRYYLKFHQQHMSHHHYAFKYDGGDFLKTTFLEIAINDGSAALLYAILAFAAYHHDVAHNKSDISGFLSYYNRSIAFLQQSLKKQRHNVATLLTILQLATIEVSQPRTKCSS